MSQTAECPSAADLFEDPDVPDVTEWLIEDDEEITEDEPTVQERPGSP